MSNPAKFLNHRVRYDVFHAVQNKAIPKVSTQVTHNVRYPVLLPTSIVSRQLFFYLTKQ